MMKKQAPAKGALWGANESIGANVVGANGEDLGNVEDIVLDRNKSRIAYLIVSYGGLLGIGDKHFAVPWEAFGQTSSRELSLGIDPEQLKSAPGFKKGALPNTADPLFHEEVHSFYNAGPYWLEQEKRAQAEAQAAQQEQTGERAFDWDSWANRGDGAAWARCLGELIGTDIENAQGETIAKLKDVIVDSREARAAFAMVSYGGTLGFSAETASIPWNALRFDLAREVYVTDVTLAQLKQAKLNATVSLDLENQRHSEAR